jgi:hypothetical protein
LFLKENYLTSFFLAGAFFAGALATLAGAFSTFSLAGFAAFFSSLISVFSTFTSTSSFLAGAFFAGFSAVTFSSFGASYHSSRALIESPILFSFESKVIIFALTVPHTFT